MWISKTEYERLIKVEKDYKNERQISYHNNQRYRDMLLCCDRLITENHNLKNDIEQLKVKYADEVKKNFELASYLTDRQKENL